MKMRILISTLFFIGITTCAPTDDSDEITTIDRSFFMDDFVIYTGDHDIVEIIVPKFKSDEDESKTKDDASNSHSPLFFVLADIKENGDKIDQGLYFLKDKKAKKLLDYGRDIDVDFSEEPTKVYFGAKDGLYIYNAKTSEAEKYGSFSDSIINLAKVNGADIFYVLTEKHELFTVTEKGTKSTLLDDVKNAQQFEINMATDLFYIDADKKIYVKTSNGIKKINGVPENPSFIQFVKPACKVKESVPVIINDSLYSLYANGTSEVDQMKFGVRQIAIGVESVLLQYYGFEKKIYEYNVRRLLTAEELEVFQNFVGDTQGDRCETKKGGNQ